MAISVKHSFNSPKVDGPDSTLVQPSSWNAEHAITLAAGKVLGRDTSMAGVVQELPISVSPAGDVSLGTTFAARASGVLQATNLPIYATNAAAITGGLTAGSIYRTTTGELRIVV